MSRIPANRDDFAWMQSSIEDGYRAQRRQSLRLLPSRFLDLLLFAALPGPIFRLR